MQYVVSSSADNILLGYLGKGGGGGDRRRLRAASFGLLLERNEPRWERSRNRAVPRRNYSSSTRLDGAEKTHTMVIGNPPGPVIKYPEGIP